MCVSDHSATEVTKTKMDLILTVVKHFLYFWFTNIFLYKVERRWALDFMPTPNSFTHIEKVRGEMVEETGMQRETHTKLSKPKGIWYHWQWNIYSCVSGLLTSYYRVKLSLVIAIYEPVKIPYMEGVSFGMMEETCVPRENHRPLVSEWINFLIQSICLSGVWI